MSLQHQDPVEPEDDHNATGIIPDTLKDSDNEETKIAILISLDSSFEDGDSNQKNNGTANDHNTSMTVVLWVCASTAALSGTKNKKTLTYYHYQDHPRQFNHTDALLQRLHPINEIQISRFGSTVSSSSKKKKKTDDSNAVDEYKNKSCPLTKILQRYKAFLEDKCLNASSNQFVSSSNASGCPLETVVATNTDISFLKGNDHQTDINRLTTIVQQLLGVDMGSVNTVSEGASENTTIIDSKAALLQFTGDTYIQQHPMVAKGLQFYFYAIENCFPNVVEEDLIGSYRKIGIHGRLDSFLILDSTAADAIHLWPPRNSGQWTVTGGTANNNSIAGIITSNACTAMGKRLLQQWLKQPLIHLTALQQRQNAVTSLVKNTVERDNLRSNGLKLFSSSSYDLSKLAMSLKKYENYMSNGDNVEGTSSNANVDNSYEENTSASGYGDGMTKLSSSGSTRKALLTLYNLNLVSSEKIPSLVQHLQSLVLDTDKPCQSSLLVKDCYEQLAICKQELHGSIELCHAVLDMDVAPNDFFVKRTYKDELNDIYNEFQSLQEEFDACHQEMNETWAEISGYNVNSNSVRLECCNNETYGPDLKYQFRVTNTNDSKILETCPNIRIHRILKNGVYFTNKALRQLSTTKSKLLLEYDMHQKEIVYQAMEIASTYTTVLYRANQAIALLDALTSLAHLASHSKNGYCCPILTDSNDDGVGIELIKARHPCVELQENANLADEFIPNDIKLTFGESSFLLVTGPNSK
jgi:MutS domain III